MKSCKIRPTLGECNMCAEITEYFDQPPDCSKCDYNTKRYELIEVVSGIFNDYAFVSSNGKMQKVLIDRVYDIREE